MDARTKELIRERRRVALAYRRSQSDSDRQRLKDIDQELARFNIDIPAILQLVAQRGAAEPQYAHPRHPGHPSQASRPIHPSH